MTSLLKLYRTILSPISARLTSSDDPDYEPERQSDTVPPCSVPDCVSPPHVHLRFELPNGEEVGGTVCSEHNHQIQSYCHGEIEPPVWMYELACKRDGEEEAEEAPP